MAINKRNYVDGQTIITAANLNEIQDCIETLEQNYVPKTRTVAGKALSSNITLAASDVGAVPTSRTINSKALSSNITLSAADVGAVPVSRTVNSKALSSNITLTAADVSAVPTSRTVNSKALSSNITLSASDVGAVPTTRTVNSKALSSNITLNASNIPNDSSVEGTTTKDAINKLADGEVTLATAINAFGSVPIAVNKGGTGATSSVDAVTEFVGSAFSVVSDTISSGVTKKYSGSRNGFRGFIFVFYPAGSSTGMYLLSVVNATWNVTPVVAPTGQSLTVTYDATGITIKNSGSLSLGVRFVNLTTAQYKTMPEITIVQ